MPLTLTLGTSMAAGLVTHGKHPFFHSESGSIHDIRHIPLKLGGYSISYRLGGRTRCGAPDQRADAHVEIEMHRYLDLNAWFLELAVHRSVEKLSLAFYELPFEPYAPVRRQLLNILLAVNKARCKAS